jgi:hypothetical protein
MNWPWMNGFVLVEAVAILDPNTQTLKLLNLPIDPNISMKN